ncbi:MAG: recombination protein NinB [Shinella sp.]|nr:recombination protein NinB [Shinella sp.]
MRFILINDHVRRNALAAVNTAPDGFSVSISEPKRSLDQNAYFHAIVGDIARSPVKWAGKRRNSDEWKALLISGHAVATQKQGEVIPGLEGEFVAIRESSARMSVRRAASLIEYTLAFCAAHNIELIDTRRQGFLDHRSAA